MTVIVTIPHDSEDIAARIVEACDLPACDFEQAVFQGLPVTHEIAAHSTIAFQYFRYGFGGAEKVTFELMQLFSEMGYRVVLYTDIEPEPNDLPVPEGVIRKHVCAGYDDRESRVEYWREQVEAEGIAALVYGSWCSPAALLDCLAVQSAGAAFLFCVHGCSPFFMQIDDPPLPLRLERVGRCADAVIVLSEADKAFWDAYNPNVHVVVNPVARYMSRVPVAESPARGHTVLWSGRFSFYEKQPADAVEILAELRKIVPDAKLVFLGAGTPEETAKLKGIVEENGVAGAVTFAGYQEDPMPYYQVADALLVTSVSEGFGLSIAEAMHQGMPVVAYDLGYLLLMQDGGVVKVPHGGIRAAASALAKLLDDPVEHDE
ncbi:MAG: glycosyltransferase, partial [Eggerthellaceae bacterium]|nr:glycosyltransferase [Eggerthellaceae bacterium]